MITKQQLCKKIEEVFPQAGSCGIDYEVDFDEQNKAWTVDLHHGSQHLKTFIDTEEADSCLEGKMCIPLGLQIAQLKRNFELANCTEN